jgi:KilA-N domain
MTKAAQAFGKEVKHFLDLDSTCEYMQALANVGKTDLYVANRGRHGGTWAHPKLALRFAQWLDVRFAVWCDAVIEDLLKGAVAASSPIVGGNRRRPRERRLQMPKDTDPTTNNAPQAWPGRRQGGLWLGLVLGRGVRKLPHGLGRIDRT